MNSAPDCAGVLSLMETERLDALAYPTWSNPPRLIGDLNTPAGDNSQLFPRAPVSRRSACRWVTPGESAPAGLQLLGRPFAEGTLFRLAFAYEQATHHRRPPPTTPPLP